MQKFCNQNITKVQNANQQNLLKEEALILLL